MKKPFSIFTGIMLAVVLGGCWGQDNPSIDEKLSTGSIPGANQGTDSAPPLNVDPDAEKDTGSALATIEEYYDYLDKGKLEEAYQMSHKSVDLETFKLWYKDLSKVSIKDMEKVAENKYRLLVSLIENGDETFYDTEIVADFDKIISSSSREASIYNALNYRNWPLYENEEYGFEFRYPPNWRFAWEVTGLGDITFPGFDADKKIELSLWPGQSEVYNEENPSIYVSFLHGSGPFGFSIDQKIQGLVAEETWLEMRWAESAYKKYNDQIEVYVKSENMGGQIKDQLHLINNQKDIIVTEHARPHGTDNRYPSITDIELSPLGNYLVYLKSYAEGRSLSVYSMQKEEESIYFIPPYIFAFTPDEKHFYACAPHGMDAGYALIYRVPEFTIEKDIEKDMGSESQPKVSTFINCHYDKENNSLTYTTYEDLATKTYYFE